MNVGLDNFLCLLVCLFVASLLALFLGVVVTIHLSRVLVVFLSLRNGSSNRWFDTRFCVNYSHLDSRDATSYSIPEITYLKPPIPET